jgi:hypothetical protein
MLPFGKDKPLIREKEKVRERGKEEEPGRPFLAVLNNSSV